MVGFSGLAGTEPSSVLKLPVSAKRSFCVVTSHDIIVVPNSIKAARVNNFFIRNIELDLDKSSPGQIASATGRMPFLEHAPVRVGSVVCRTGCRNYTSHDNFTA